MAPIYDTDLAEERFSKDEWNQYELWEKVEIRMRRRKRLWIGAACVAFVLLSSVPIVMDRLPKWKSLGASRRLAQEINRIKRDASLSHSAFRIRFAGNGSMDFVVERGPSCSGQVTAVERSGSLMPARDSGTYELVPPAQGSELGVKGFTESICYDYLAGSDVVLRGDNLVGFGIMPVNDVTDRRMDRLAILIASGPSAEISFE
jgi:hypothetical protein